MVIARGWQGGTITTPAGEIPVDAVIFILALIAVFILIGFYRGLVRELILTLFIIGAQFILTHRFDSLVAWVNRLYRMFLFALKGGLVADDPVAIWTSVRKLPPLVETQQEKLAFTIAFLAGAVILGYVVGNGLVKAKLPSVGIPLLWRPRALLPHILGALGGAVNGYLIVNYLLPRLLTKPTTVIIVPAGKVSDLLQINLINVAIAILLIIIIVGLQASSGRRQQG